MTELLHFALFSLADVIVEAAALTVGFCVLLLVVTSAVRFISELFN